MNEVIHEDQNDPTIVSTASGSIGEQVPQTIEEEVHTSPLSVQSRIEPIPQGLVNESQEVRGEPQKPPQEVRRSTRVRMKHNFYLGLHEILVLDTEDPTIFQEAMNRDDSHSWHEVMKSKIQSMYDNQVMNELLSCFDSK